MLSDGFFLNFFLVNFLTFSLIRSIDSDCMVGGVWKGGKKEGGDKSRCLIPGGTREEFFQAVLVVTFVKIT